MLASRKAPACPYSVPIRIVISDSGDAAKRTSSVLELLRVMGIRKVRTCWLN